MLACLLAWLLLMYHVVLSKFCHFSETQLPHLKNRNDATPGQLSHENYMGLLLAHHRPSINSGCGLLYKWRSYI